MIFNIVTLFPHLIEPYLQDGVVGRAHKKGLIKTHFFSPRDYSSDAHHTVDDRPFGGGDGMVMMIEPLCLLLEDILAKDPETLVIYLSPQGSVWSDKFARSLYSEIQVDTQFRSITFICGRYSGVDQRVLNKYVNLEISLGDYVLSGGEIAATAILDTLCRFHPGVLGHEDSAHIESHANGLLEAPCFTRPREHDLGNVPEVLLSGNHSKIEEWRGLVSQCITWKKRPDLLGEKGGLQFTKGQKKIIKSIFETKDLEVCGFNKNEIEELKKVIREKF